jgi:hypothetical protein
MALDDHSAHQAPSPRVAERPAGVLGLEMSTLGWRWPAVDLARLLHHRLQDVQLRLECVDLPLQNVPNRRHAAYALAPMISTS